jgi:hypothetical protein
VERAPLILTGSREAELEVVAGLAEVLGWRVARANGSLPLLPSILDKAFKGEL